MAITVEDGTVVTGANSYISESALTAYATARGITLTGDTEQLLIKAMDYVEGLSFIGLKYTEAQPLQWPRSSVYIDGYLNNLNTIPQLLKDGLAEVAIAIDQSDDPLSTIDRLQKRVQVGPLSVEYESGGTSTQLVRRIYNKFYKIINGGNGNSFKVNRG